MDTDDEDRFPGLEPWPGRRFAEEGVAYVLKGRRVGLKGKFNVDLCTCEQYGVKACLRFLTPGVPTRTGLSALCDHRIAARAAWDAQPKPLPEFHCRIDKDLYCVKDGIVGMRRGDVFRSLCPCAPDPTEGCMKLVRPSYGHTFAQGCPTCTNGECSTPTCTAPLHTQKLCEKCDNIRLYGECEWCEGGLRKDGSCRNCELTNGAAKKRLTGIAQCVANVEEGVDPNARLGYTELGVSNGHMRYKDVAASEKGVPYWRAHKPDYAPRRSLFTKCGTWNPVCTHVEDGVLCGQAAQPVDGGPVACIKHGGGVRCIGTELNGKREACPFGLCADKHGKGKYGPHCVRCFCRQNPDADLAKVARANYMAKEQEVRKVLEEAFPEYRWHFNGGYAVGVLKRPDARTRRGDRVILVEVDEFSHKYYACGKERERERLFFEYAEPGVTVVMVRFNPDGYTDVQGRTFPSCFRKSGKTEKEKQKARELGLPESMSRDLVSLDPKQSREWKRRMDGLVHWVRVFTDPESPDYIEIVPEPLDGRCIFIQELFYDKAPTEAERRARLEGLARGKRKRAEAQAAARAVASKPSEAGSSSDHARQPPRNYTQTTLSF